MVKGRRCGSPLREHRVPVPHQQDVLPGIATAGAGLVIQGPVIQDCADAVAVLLLRQDLDRNPMRRHEPRDLRADGIDAFLVVAAAIGVHHLPQHVEHGALLGGEPVGDLGVHRYSTLPMRCTARSSRALSSSKNFWNSGASR
jgi:hypothetical protein